MRLLRPHERVSFAVVADEVRALATKSRDASEQISTLVNRIDDSTTKVSKQIEGLHTSTIHVSQSCERLSLSFEKTATSSNKLVTVGYQSMAFAHSAASLLELNQWKSGHLIAALKGPTQQRSEIQATHMDIRDTNFGDWYYNGTDNEFNFRQQSSFIKINDELQKIEYLAESMRHFDGESFEQLAATEASMSSHIEAIYQHLDAVQSFLFQNI